MYLCVYSICKLHTYDVCCLAMLWTLELENQAEPPMAGASPSSGINAVQVTVATSTSILSVKKKYIYIYLILIYTMICYIHILIYLW